MGAASHASLQVKVCTTTDEDLESASIRLGWGVRKVREGGNWKQRVHRSWTDHKTEFQG